MPFQPSPSTTVRRASSEATLLEAGYRQVAFFGHAHDTGSSINAAKDFSTPHGLTAFSTLFELQVVARSDQIRESARRILAGSARAQAIFAASNIAAKGVIPAIQSVGLRIPEDIALLVMDDLKR